MKFNININQKGLENDKEITLVEASVIDWIYTFCGTNNKKINRQKIDGWTWISCNHLIQDMPLLRINSRSGCSKLLTRLENLGYIEIKREPRKLFIKTTDKMDNLYVSSGKQLVDSEEQTVDSGKQNCKLQDTYHNTNNIILDHNTVSDSKATSTEVIRTGQLPLTSGRTYIDRVLKIYNILFRNLYGFSPTISIPRFGKELKKLLQSKSEVQVSALLIAFFDWAGMDGRDDRERSKLVASSHNPFWFFSTVNQYEAKLRNVDGLDLDNEEAVKDFVAKSISSIKK